MPDKSKDTINLGNGYEFVPLTDSELIECLVNQGYSVEDANKEVDLLNKSESYGSAKSNDFTFQSSLYKDERGYVRKRRSMKEAPKERPTDGQIQILVVLRSYYGPIPSASVQSSYDQPTYRRFVKILGSPGFVIPDSNGYHIEEGAHAADIVNDGTIVFDSTGNLVGDFTFSIQLQAAFKAVKFTIQASPTHLNVRHNYTMHQVFDPNYPSDLEPLE